MPVSVTVIVATLASDETATVMWPPGSVYLAALLSRFEKICASRTRSP